MPGKLAPNPQQLLTDAADPGNAWKAYYYEPDGAFSTLKTVYKDAALQTAWMQPVDCGVDGRPENDSQVFLDGDYDRKIVNSTDGTEFTERNIGETWSAVGTDLSKNLVSNHSFETAGASNAAANWTDTDSGSVITRDTSDSSHGTASLKFTNSNNGSDYVTSDAFEISPEQALVLAFSVLASNAAANPKITVDWLTGAQASISTSTIYDGDNGNTPTSWERLYGFSVSPPATARYAKLNLIGNTAATQYTVSFDQIEVRQENVFPIPAPLIPFGLQISRDTDTDHDLNITAGACRDATNVYDMILRSEITKRFDASWAVGDDAGGDDGSGLPDTDIYYVWLILDSSTGNVDVLGSTSPTSPTMPSGYDVKRLIGAWLTDSSNNFIGGFHKDDLFEFFAVTGAVFDSSITDDTYETATVPVPPNCLGKFSLRWNYGSGQQSLVELKIRNADSSNDNGSFAANPTSATVDELRAILWVSVNASSQIDYTVHDDTSGAITGDLDIDVLGFRMLTRNAP